MTHPMSFSAAPFYTHDASYLPLPQVSSTPNFTSFFPFFFQSAQSWAQCYSQGVTSYSFLRYSVYNTKYDGSFPCRSSCLAFALQSPITSILIMAITGKKMPCFYIHSNTTCCMFYSKVLPHTELGSNSEICSI